MPSKDKSSYQLTTDYQKDNLLKPSKVVVHVGTNHTLLFNNNEDQAIYSKVMKGSNEIIKDLLDNKENYTLSSMGIDQLQRAREGNTVELIFKASTEIEQLKSLLDVQKNLWNEIKQVTSIIISPDENKVYIVDKSKAAIYQFAAVRMSKVLEEPISEITSKEDFAYVFLSDFNEENSNLYGENAIAPVSIVTMPVMEVKREVETDTKLSTNIAELFDEDESNKISSIRDADGTVTFTDREEETVKVDADGVLEYYKYNVTSDEIRYSNTKEAIEIAVGYVNQHFGFKGDFYLSDIESRMQGGRTSYIVRFDYKYNGMPVITEGDSGNSAIEVEIVGQEVKRYKRNIREVVSTDKTVNIKTFDEILNIVQGGLDKYLGITKSESIKKINDLYLGYLERNEKLIPVWVVDVDVESSIRDIKITNNKKYIIGAEEGAILEEQ